MNQNLNHNQLEKNKIGRNGETGKVILPRYIYLNSKLLAMVHLNLRIINGQIVTNSGHFVTNYRHSSIYAVNVVGTHKKTREAKNAESKNRVN